MAILSNKVSERTMTICESCGEVISTSGPFISVKPLKIIRAGFCNECKKIIQEEDDSPVYGCYRLFISETTIISRKTFNKILDHVKNKKNNSGGKRCQI